MTMLMKTCLFALLIVAADAFAPTSRVVTTNFGNHGLTTTSRSPAPSAVQQIQIHAPLVVHGDDIHSSTTTQLSASSSKKASIEIPSEAKPFLSASILILLDIAFRQILRKAAISFPSSLAGCGALFVTLLTLPIGPKLFDILSPGAALLAKWLPVFFVPSLITLPLAAGMGSTMEVVKVLSVVLAGFYFTLLTTAGSVVGIRKLFAEKTNVNALDDAKEELVDAKNEAVKVIDQAAAAPVKAFSDELMKGLRLFTAVTGAAALQATTSGSAAAMSSITALFMLSTTLHNFVFGARLPKKFTKVVHPLVTCTALTWNVALLFAVLCGTTFKSMLKGYRTSNLSLLGAGAGDVLLFLLGPAVISLAISMYDRRQLMKANFKEVVTAIGVSSFGGLFGTAAAVRLLGIISPCLRLSLLSRNITTPLAMAIASILGADVSIAVSMVVLTGLFGANFGTSILDSFGIQDPVARGLGMGAAAHGLGTAAIVSEKDAFPFSAISMALTASACTVLVSIPIIKKMVLKLALGV